eukprot:9389742-Pyramimonas_sp.AAC.1
MWTGLMEGDAQGSFNLATEPPGVAPSQGDAFHGVNFQQFTLTAGSGRVGVSNHGLNCQHGLHFVYNRLYEGYTYLRAHGEVSFDQVQVQVTLEDTTTKQVGLYKQSFQQSNVRSPLPI